MRLVRSNHRWIVWISVLAALILEVFPLPETWSSVRPPWLLLVLMYWVLFMPYLFGIITVGCLGVFLDLLKGGLLGEQAFLYAFIIYIALKMSQQFRMFPWWQQGLFVGVLLIIAQVLHVWIRGIVGLQAELFGLWPILFGLGAWPLLFGLLHYFRRRFNVT